MDEVQYENTVEEQRFPNTRCAVSVCPAGQSGGVSRLTSNRS